MAQSKFGKKVVLRTVKHAAAAEIPKKDLVPNITPGVIKSGGAVVKPRRGRGPRAGGNR